MLSGLEPNPGPNTNNLNSHSNNLSDHDSNYEDTPDCSSEFSCIYDLVSNSVSFLHLTVQSIIPKLDLIAAEYTDFDILSFTESWLKDTNTADSIELLNYQIPFRNDRGEDKKGGGIVVYVKDNIYTMRRFDLEIQDIEMIWIQLKICNNKVLFGIFYLPPHSSIEIWGKVQSFIESAVNDVNCDYVIATGDCNDNQECVNSRMKRICTSYSLEQLITDPTNFAEHSPSILDLIVTNSIDFVSYTGMMPP